MERWRWQQYGNWVRGIEMKKGCDRMEVKKLNLSQNVFTFAEKCSMQE
jgi:hypothetical protein